MDQGKIDKIPPDGPNMRTGNFLLFLQGLILSAVVKLQFADKNKYIDTMEPKDVLISVVSSEVLFIIASAEQ